MGRWGSTVEKFGLVLYEMLSGKAAYGGGSAASVIAAILERGSPSLADVVPPAVERALQRCLAKDPEQRWQSARDLKAALHFAVEPPPAPRAHKVTSWGWIAAGCCLILAFIAGWYALRPSYIEEHTFQFKIEPPSGTEFVLGAACVPFWAGLVCRDGFRGIQVLADLSRPRSYQRSTRNARRVFHRLGSPTDSPSGRASASS